MNFFILALRSLKSRWTTSLLTLLIFAVSVGFLSSIEKVSKSLRSSFETTISKTDLILGPRAGTLDLLMYAVFHVGRPVASMSYESFKKYETHSDVSWAIPISLGDSYRSYPVVATNTNFFSYYTFGKNQKLTFVSGKVFGDEHDVVLGAAVADSLNMKLGDEIHLSHGSGEADFHIHENHGLHIVGILQPTGTPVDRSVHISLEAMAEIHEVANGPPGLNAVFIGLKNPRKVFAFQQIIREDKHEALMALLPGVALQQLWLVLGGFHTFLNSLGWVFYGVSLITLFLVIMTSINERKHELEIFRTLGSAPSFIVKLVSGEAVLLALIGSCTGILLSNIAFFVLKPFIEVRLGARIQPELITRFDLFCIMTLTVGAVVASLWPAIQLYRKQAL